MPLSAEDQAVSVEDAQDVEPISRAGEMNQRVAGYTLSGPATLYPDKRPAGPWISPLRDGAVDRYALAG